MAPKYITSSRPRLLSSSPSPLPSTESMKPSSTIFHKNLPNKVEGQQGYQIAAAEHRQLTVLRDTYTSFMFPPFLVSIAGALMGKSTYLGLYKAKLTSDVVVLSSNWLSNAQHFSAVRFVPASQLSLLWRTPWTYATFGRAYGSAAESRKREIRVSDEEDDDNDGGAEEPSEFEDDSDVEDEQRIEDSDDDDEEDEGDQEPQSQGLPKKKIQTKPPKPKHPDQQGRVLNEKITARILRLVNDDGKGHRIISRDEALTIAKGKKMDLVQVDGRADPPVCKIFDFNKEEYKQEQILKDRKKQKGVMSRLNEVKELRFNSKTEPKDLRMKVEQAKEFMSRGYRVKFVAIFKGKPDDEKKRLEEEKMIDAIYPMMEDVAAIEQGPRVESRQAWVMLRHAKFAKKKSSKHEPQIKATGKVESVKQEDHASSEPDFYEGQEGKIMHAQNGSNISEKAAMGRLQGYPSEPIAPPTQSMAFRSPHPQVQSPQLQDTVEAFGSEMYSPPLHAFPQGAQSLQGSGGLKGSEMAISSPPGPLSSIPSVQRAGVQGAKFQSLHPGVSPLPASSLQGSEGMQRQQIKPSPLDGISLSQSEQHPSHTPKIQMFSVPSQSQGILSQRESPNIIGAPRLEKVSSSEETQSEYPVTSRGRGIPPPNQSSHSLFSSTPLASLRGPPPNRQGSLLNLSQSPPMPPARQMLDPSNFQGPLPNASPSTPVTLSHQGGLSNLESPLADFISSPLPPKPQHAPSSRGFNPDPSPLFATQNVRERYSPPLQGTEGLAPQKVPRYPPPPSQGFPSKEVSRYSPSPIGQPRYAPPLGKPDLQNPRGEFAPGNQHRQLQGPDFMHQMQSQPQPAIEAAAQNSEQQNYRPMQGQDRYVPTPNLFGSPQHSQQVPPNQGPQQGPPSLFRSPLHPQQGPPDLVGSPQGPQKGPPGLFGSPLHPQQGPSDLIGSTQGPQKGPSSLFGSLLRPQQGHPGPVRSPQGAQQGPQGLFGSPPGPQQGPPSLFGSPPGPQQGPPSLFGPPPHPQRGPPNLIGSPQGPQQGPPSFFGSRPGPQQGPPGLFGSPPHPQQGLSNFFGSQQHAQHGPSEPSQVQSGYQPVGVSKGPQQGGPWLSQQGPPRYVPPVPSYPQQTGQPSPQGHQGYVAQQDAQGGSQNYWQSQASQGFPSQQNQAPQGYPPPRGFPQTRLAQGAFNFQGNQPQNQVSQASPPPRGFPQARPVVPSPSGFRPSWTAPPPSQEHSSLFEFPTDESGV